MQIYHGWVVMETLGLITHYKKVGNDVLEALALSLFNESLNRVVWSNFLRSVFFIQ